MAGKGRRQGQTTPFDCLQLNRLAWVPALPGKWAVGSCSCPGVGNISHLVSPTQMRIREVHFSPLSCSCWKTAEGNIFFTSKAAILGDFLHHAGEKQCLSITSPSYRTIWLLSPPQLTLTSIPWDSSPNGWEGSCLSTAHHMLQPIRTPRWLHPLLSPCSHSKASCKPLASNDSKHGATDGLGVQSDPSSLLVEGGQPVYFDRHSGLLGGWLRKPLPAAGQMQDGFSVMLAWSLLAIRV